AQLFAQVADHRCRLVADLSIGESTGDFRHRLQVLADAEPVGGCALGKVAGAHDKRDRRLVPIGQLVATPATPVDDLAELALAGAERPRLTSRATSTSSRALITRVGTRAVGALMSQSGARLALSVGPISTPRNRSPATAAARTGGAFSPTPPVNTSASRPFIAAAIDAMSARSRWTYTSNASSARSSPSAMRRRISRMSGVPA